MIGFVAFVCGDFLHFKLRHFEIFCHDDWGFVQFIPFQQEFFGRFRNCNNSTNVWLKKSKRIWIESR